MSDESVASEEAAMELLEVYADVACPFAHAGLARFVAFRDGRCLTEPRLHVRAWPLELVNGSPFDGYALAPKVAALRAEVAPDRFSGFDPASFPRSSLSAMVAEAAAHRTSPDVGERFSLAVRSALFDDGQDVSDPEVLARLRSSCGVEEPTSADVATVRTDYEIGIQRGVRGSPHFFAAGDSFFCPSLRIDHGDDGYEVSFDSDGFHRFASAVFEEPIPGA